MASSFATFPGGEKGHSRNPKREARLRSRRPSMALFGEDFAAAAAFMNSGMASRRFGRRRADFQFLLCPFGFFLLPQVLPRALHQRNAAASFLPAVVGA